MDGTDADAEAAEPAEATTDGADATGAPTTAAPTTDAPDSGATDATDAEDMDADPEAGSNTAAEVETGTDVKVATPSVPDAMTTSEAEPSFRAESLSNSVLETELTVDVTSSGSCAAVETKGAGKGTTPTAISVPEIDSPAADLGIEAKR